MPLIIKLFRAMNMSTMDSNGVARPSRRYRPRIHTRDDWQDMRPIIESLYKQERLPQHELMSELSKLGFHVTLHQLKSRIAKWGLNRKITRQEYLSMLRKQQVRTQQGLKTIFIIRGDVVDDDKLKRATQRFWSDMNKANDIPTPPDLECLTPCSSEDADGLEVTQATGEDVPPATNAHDTIISSDYVDPEIQLTEEDIHSHITPGEVAVPPLAAPLPSTFQTTLPMHITVGKETIQGLDIGEYIPVVPSFELNLYSPTACHNFNTAYYFAVVEPDDEIELWRLYPDLHLENNDLALVHPQSYDATDNDDGCPLDQRQEFNKILNLISVFHDAHLGMDRDMQIAACLDTWSLAISKYNICNWKATHELQTRVVEWLPKLVPHNHPWLVTSMGLLASSCGEQGRLGEAEHYHFTQTLRSRTINGEGHLVTLNSEHGLALLYMHTGRLEEATALARSSYTGQKAALGENHLDTIYSLMTLGSIALRARQWEAAKKILLRVIKDFTKHLGRNHIFTFRACQELCSVFLDAGHPGVACRLWKKVVDRMQATLEYDHHDLMEGMMRLARAHIAMFEFSRAIDSLLVVSAIWERQYGDGSPVQQEVLLDIATSYDGLNDIDTALAYQRRAVAANGQQTHHRLHLLRRYREGVARYRRAGYEQEAVELGYIAERVALSLGVGNDESS